MVVRFPDHYQRDPSGVYDRLTNPHMTEMAIQPPQLGHLLDMKPTLTLIQFILPEELTQSPLQLVTLQETFGPLGEIAEIFLFKPRPEGSSFSTAVCRFPTLTGYCHRNTA